MYSRTDQIKFQKNKDSLQKISSHGLFKQMVFHKFYIVHFWIFCYILHLLQNTTWNLIYILFAKFSYKKVHNNSNSNKNKIKCPIHLSDISLYWDRNYLTISNYWNSSYPVDTRRKLNFLCTFNLRPVSTG